MIGVPTGKDHWFKFVVARSGDIKRDMNVIIFVVFGERELEIPDRLTVISVSKASPSSASLP